MTFTLPKIMSQEFIGDMAEFITFRCQVFLGFVYKKNTKIGYGSLIIFKNERGGILKDTIECNNIMICMSVAFSNDSLPEFESRS